MVINSDGMVNGINTQFITINKLNWILFAIDCHSIIITIIYEGFLYLKKNSSGRKKKT